MRYQLIASGTFDLLHIGHKSFLKKSLELADEVIVCITSNSYVESFKIDGEVEDFEIRKNKVVEFLISIGALDKVKIITIEDIYGPLLTNQFNSQAIAVTPENEKNAVKINIERVKKGLPKLEIKLVSMDLADDGGVISSTRIRRGEINRDGRAYVRKSWLKNSLVLPQSLRSTLQKPFGKVLTSIPSGLNPEKIITIGDITTQKFNQENIGQFLSIVDFAVNRQKKFDKLSDLGFAYDIKMIETESPAGSISPELFEAVKKTFQTKDRQVILVKGEEDLAVLPVMLLAPLGFFVYYGQPRLGRVQAGQPNEGLVEVPVTEENKEKAYDLVNKFTS